MDARAAAPKPPCCIEGLSREARPLGRPGAVWTMTEPSLPEPITPLQARAAAGAAPSIYYIPKDHGFERFCLMLMLGSAAPIGDPSSWCEAVTQRWCELPGKEPLALWRTKETGELWRLAAAEAPRTSAVAVTGPNSERCGHSEEHKSSATNQGE